MAASLLLPKKNDEPYNGNNRVRSALTTVLKIGLAVGLIYWMVQKGFLDLSSLTSHLLWYHYALAFLLVMASISCNNWRWSVLLKDQKLPHRFFEVYPLTLIGMFFNFAIPGGVGGDVVKGYYLIRGKSDGRINAVMTIFVDRLVGLWAMAFLATVGFLFNYPWASDSAPMALLMWSVFAVFFSFCALCVLTAFVAPVRFEAWFSFLRKTGLGQKLLRVYTAFYSYCRKPKLLALAFLFSIGSQSLAVLFIMLVGHLLEPQLSPSIYFFVVPVGFIAMALPIAPAGVGVGQAVLFFLFNSVLGRESQLGPNGMTAFQIVTFCWSLLGAYFYIRMGSIKGDLNRAG